MTDDAALIEEAIRLSGLSARQFAAVVLGRDERTIRRWQSGEQAIPPAARVQLERWITGTSLQRETLIALYWPGPGSPDWHDPEDVSRVVLDVEDGRWYVDIVPPVGHGFRAEGDPIPQPRDRVIRFTRIGTGEIRSFSGREVDADDPREATVEQLQAWFEQAKRKRQIL